MSSLSTISKFASHGEIQQKMIAKENGEYMALAMAPYGLPDSCAPRHKDSPYGR